MIRLLSGTYAGISNRSIAKLSKALGCELTIQQRPTPYIGGLLIPTITEEGIRAAAAYGAALAREKLVPFGRP